MGSRFAERDWRSAAADCVQRNHSKDLRLCYTARCTQGRVVPLAVTNFGAPREPVDQGWFKRSERGSAAIQG
jgi:hypothetical protein